MQKDSSRSFVKWLKWLPSEHQANVTTKFVGTNVEFQNGILITPVHRKETKLPTL